MHIDSETEGVPIEVIDGVEVLQESITDKEQVLVLAWESALVDNEVAFLMARLVKVLFWVDLENIIRHLETNWLQLRSDVLARILDVAEGLIRGAVEVGESGGPLGSNLLENIWRNGQLGGASVDNSWVRGVLTWLLHWLISVVHALSLKSPGTKPILEVSKGLETLGTSNDLSRVITSEESIWSFAHLL